MNVRQLCWKVAIVASSRKTTVESPDVSPYLQRRLRTLEEALEDIAAASRFRCEPAASSPWRPARRAYGEAETRFGIQLSLFTQLGFVYLAIIAL
jgi:hypothetical protein